MDISASFRVKVDEEVKCTRAAVKHMTEKNVKWRVGMSHHSVYNSIACIAVLQRLSEIGFWIMNEDIHVYVYFKLFSNFQFWEFTHNMTIRLGLSESMISFFLACWGKWKQEMTQKWSPHVYVYLRPNPGQFHLSS